MNCFDSSRTKEQKDLSKLLYKIRYAASLELRGIECEAKSKIGTNFKILYCEKDFKER